MLSLPGPQLDQSVCATTYKGLQLMRYQICEKREFFSFLFFFSKLWRAGAAPACPPSTAGCVCQRSPRCCVMIPASLLISAGMICCPTVTFTERQRPRVCVSADIISSRSDVPRISPPPWSVSGCSWCPPACCTVSLSLCLLVRYLQTSPTLSLV